MRFMMLSCVLFLYACVVTPESARSANFVQLCNSYAYGTREDARLVLDEMRIRGRAPEECASIIAAQAAYEQQRRQQALDLGVRVLVPGVRY